MKRFGNVKKKLHIAVLLTNTKTMNLTKIEDNNQMVGFIFRGRVYFEEDTPQATFGNIAKYAKIFKVQIVEDLQQKFAKIVEKYS